MKHLPGCVFLLYLLKFFPLFNQMIIEIETQIKLIE
jgi:hypothetical protein